MKFMSIFLRARHWQLFLLLFGIPFLFQVYMISAILSTLSEPYPYANPDSVSFAFSGPFLAFPVMMVVMLVVFFGWFWSIGIGLHPKLPADVEIRTTFFKVSVLFPFLYITTVSVGVGLMMSDLFNPVQSTYHESIAAFGSVLMFLHLFAIICIFYSLYFVAKTLKTVELQRKATFSDFAGEFFLIWFFPIGIWIIQPRVNKLVN